jgi:hypothetical protein
MMSPIYYVFTYNYFVYDSCSSRAKNVSVVLIVE